MTAHRRTRKTKNKRSNSDVDSYTERYRKASDAAKAARAAAERRPARDVESIDPEAFNLAYQDGQEIRIVENARIKSVSLVKEGTGAPGYILEVGDSAVPRDKELKTTYERGDEGRNWYADDPDDWSESFRRQEGTVYDLGYSLHPEETLREAGSPDTAPVVERGSSEVQGQSPAEQKPRSTHKVFFEAEVNGIATYVGDENCFCSETQHHWKELGEN